MKYAVPVFSGRVAPRCTIADSIMIIKIAADSKGTILTNTIESRGSGWMDILKLITSHRVDFLVCGGINNDDKNYARSLGIRIIDNVACSIDELTVAIQNNTLRPGFGFSAVKTVDNIQENDIEEEGVYYINCLNCKEKSCLAGNPCKGISGIDIPDYKKDRKKIIDISRDISYEYERKLCRLSELVYFALEMNYRKIGVAYCTDLQEATEILVSVLKRFFQVFPVCCKINNFNPDEDYEKESPPCNPAGQAKILNLIGTDMNISVGLCIGSDCIFNQDSEAPVTTLFVKDKSLANNPIGALYSDYYLKEATENMKL